VIIDRSEMETAGVSVRSTVIAAEGCRRAAIPDRENLSLQHRAILVIGINYAPEPTGIAPYTTGMAEYLATRARSVEVITGLPHYPTWRVDPSYRGRAARSVEAAHSPNAPGMPEVRRLWHHVPARQTALTRAAYEATFLAAASLVRPRRRPDLVIAVTPSLGGAVAGVRTARRYGVPLVVVVQDLMARAAGQSGIRGGGVVAGATGRMEGFSLRQADRVLVVSDAFRPAVRAYGVPEHRIGLLPNWRHITPTLADRDEARARLGWRPDRFVVAHTGNMGLKQDLGTVVEAARHLPDGVEVLLLGDGSQRRDLERQAAGVPAIRFVGTLDDVQYPLALAAADVLLVNERPTVGDMSLPSKLTSYLSAGRPVLAAVAPDGATAAELARSAGAGLLVAPGDPGALAAAVLRLRGDDARRAAMGAAGRRYAAARLDVGTTMRRLDDFLDELLGAPAAVMAQARAAR